MNQGGGEDNVGDEALAFEIGFGDEDLAAASQDAARVLEVKKEQPAGIDADIFLGFAPAVAVIELQPAGVGFDGGAPPPMRPRSQSSPPPSKRS